jgi:4-alpha-glucanotransferase
MAQLGILSLRIQRMPNDSRKRFDLPQEYPYMSVCSTSTHDMPPLRVWWERNRSENQSYFNHVLGMHGQAPYFAEDWLCQAIIRQHLNSPSMWAIFPIQDLLGMQLDLRRDDPFAELINDPSISNHTWQYRLHLSVEQLLEHKHFAQKLQQMILQSGRYA